MRKTITKQDVPLLTGSDSLQAYINSVQKFDMLSSEDEFEFAKEWYESKNKNAAHFLITSHLRLVVKIAYQYKHYKFSLIDLISEGNLGLMKAVKNFNPFKGFRLSSYAIKWIRASIKEYMIRSWSLVKIGTTKLQKKLFFSLKYLKEDIQNMDDSDIKTAQEIINMGQRISNQDISLNQPFLERTDSLQDNLMCNQLNQEEKFIADDESRYRKKMFQQAIEKLSPRERDILLERHLVDKPVTLSQLAKKHSISIERVRQIEEIGKEKIKHTISNQET